MKGSLENLPAILAEAAKSPLGIMALAMVIICVVAVILFRKEPDWRVRISVYGILVMGLGFGAISVQEASVVHATGGRNGNSAAKPTIAVKHPKTIEPGKTNDTRSKESCDPDDLECGARNQ